MGARPEQEGIAMTAVSLAPEPIQPAAQARAVFTCDQTVLVDALATVELALDPRPAAPELGGVLLAAVDGAMLVAAASWHTSIAVRVPAADADGELLIDHAELSNVLAALAKGRSKAEISAMSVTVVADDPLQPVLDHDGLRVPLTAYSLEDFQHARDELPLVAQLDHTGFAAAVTRVTKAASTDEVLPAFCGIKLDVGDGAVTVAGTDRFRLAVAPVPAITIRTASTDGGGVIPVKLLEKLTKRLTGDRLRIGWERTDDATSISLACGPVTVVTRSTTDSFVDYRELLPTAAVGTVVTNRAELRAVAARAAAIAAAKRLGYQHLELVVGPLSLTVLPVLDERASEVAAPGLDADVDGLGEEEDLVVRFNAKYFIEALDTFPDADQITLHLVSSVRPAVLADTPAAILNPAAFRHLLMPVRRPTD
jgi:DNA polymerase-3 subunit beta